MSSGTQVDLDWYGTEMGQGGSSVPPAGVPNIGAAGGAYLTDEEILGLDPPSRERRLRRRGRHGSDSIHPQ